MRKNKKSTLNHIDGYCDFSGNKVYQIMCRARKKNNPEIEDEITYKDVLRTENGYEQKINDIYRRAKKHKDLLFYLYISVNARDALSAFYNLHKTMTDWCRGINQGDDAVYRKIDSIDERWYSELMKKRNSATNYFLFDIDFNEEGEVEYLSDFIRKLEDVSTAEMKPDNCVDLLKKIEKTPNGFHAITEPFNHNLINLPNNVDLNTDGLFLADTISCRGGK